MFTIRHEKPSDFDSVYEINKLAFQSSSEADLVNLLRKNDLSAISLVAETDSRIIGHILFTEAKIVSQFKTIHGMALAPMSVHPDFQNRGIGQILVNHGLSIVQEKNSPFVIVLGHPNYYPRFGFEIASKHNIKPQWEGIPDEAFMILILNRDLLYGVKGTAFYRQEFNPVL